MVGEEIGVNWLDRKSYARLGTLILETVTAVTQTRCKNKQRLDGNRTAQEQVRPYEVVRTRLQRMSLDGLCPPDRQIVTAVHWQEQANGKWRT